MFHSFFAWWNISFHQAFNGAVRAWQFCACQAFQAFVNTNCHTTIVCCEFSVTLLFFAQQDISFHQAGCTECAPLSKCISSVQAQCKEVLCKCMFEVSSSNSTAVCQQCKTIISQLDPHLSAMQNDHRLAQLMLVSNSTHATQQCKMIFCQLN